MKSLKIKGLINVEGMKFHSIEGGFGENKKAMLVKDIANIHKREVKRINEIINRNRKRFKNYIDIIDLKVVAEIDLLIFKNLGLDNSSILNSKNIYILSERGYSKLLKILEDDFAWEQYEKLVDGYFNMRNVTTNQYQSLSKELQAILMLDKKTQEQNEKIIKQDKRLTKIENTMTIDYSQQQELHTLANRSVIKVLGGKDTPAYKELSKKAFATIWRDFKRMMNVSSYRNTAVKEFERAIGFLKEWKPNRELHLMIKGANSQLILDV